MKYAYRILTEYNLLETLVGRFRGGYEISMSLLFTMIHPILQSCFSMDT